MKKIITFILIVSVLVISLSSCSADGGRSRDDDAKTSVVVMLDWLVNTNHTGLFVALESGYFAEEGIEVEIRERGQDASLVVVGQERADFGISAQEQVTFARTAENPQPVVAIAAILQRNTTAFASLASEGIYSASDFEGRIYGHNNMPTDMPIIDTLMRLDGADPALLTNVALGVSDAFAALETEIDIIKIFRGWTGVQAELLGIELNYVMIGEADERFDNYTPLIISNESFLRENPETVERFLRAVSRGYEFAAQNPLEAAELLHKHAPETDIELLYRSILFLSAFYVNEDGRFGHMREEVWSKFAEFCLENGIIERELDVNEAFTNEFLP